MFSTGKIFIEKERRMAAVSGEGCRTEIIKREQIEEASGNLEILLGHAR
jgi:hypothetical protein